MSLDRVGGGLTWCFSPTGMCVISLSGAQFTAFADVQNSFGYNAPWGSGYTSTNLPPVKIQPFPDQQVDSHDHLQMQINNIFQQNGMSPLPQNFVQEKLNDALKSAAIQFGRTPGTTSATRYGTLEFGSPGSQSVSMHNNCRPILYPSNVLMTFYCELCAFCRYQWYFSVFYWEEGLTLEAWFRTYLPPLDRIR